MVLSNGSYSPLRAHDKMVLRVAPISIHSDDGTNASVARLKKYG